jgi:hypothetical protein
MCILLDMDPAADLQTCFETLTDAAEFKEQRLRTGEGPVLTALGKDDRLRYKLERPVKTPA